MQIWFWFLDENNILMVYFFQLVEDPASVEMLYSLFSDLLDRKLQDVSKQKKITEPEELQDDYMAQMTVSVSELRSFLDWKKKKL